MFASDNGVIGIYDVSSKDIALYYTEMKITKIIKQSEDTIIAISDSKLKLYKII